MEKFKEFIKSKKEYILALSSLFFSCIIMFFVLNLLKVYNIDVKHSFLIYISSGLSYLLFDISTILIFNKNKM